MKYLFINTVADFGSTGKLIVSACEALQRQGHTCYIAYGRKGAACQIPTVAIGSTRDYLIHALGHRLFGTGGFGSKSATRAFLQWVRGYDPDVIWLHNLHGYYIHIGLLFDYLRQSGKEIRWTLHDCWAFTGNCPYFSMAQCEKWKHGCGSCPQKGVYPKALLDATAENYRKKKALFTGIPNLTLQVPSRWLAELVRESFLKDYPIEVVPNTVDRAVFKPTPGSFRESHHLEGKFLVLGPHRPDGPAACPAAPRHSGPSPDKESAGAGHGLYGGGCICLPQRRGDLRHDRSGGRLLRHHPHCL